MPSLNAVGRPTTQLSTLHGVLRAALEAQREESRITIRWPSPRWENDICGFAETILGIKPYKRQRELLLAIQNNRMVACKSGHRTGKSNSVAIAALWFHCTFEESRVPFTAPTNKQVQEVVWHEIKRLHARSGVCHPCRELGIEEQCSHSQPIGGIIRARASSGLRQKDGRQIFGFSTAKAGGATGIAGKNLFLIVDEASDVSDEIFEALHGNRAGNSRMLLTGNPVRIKGEFYNAFHKQPSSWLTLTISSYESPNCTGEVEIGGLATPEWIQERLQSWGDQSSEFKSRVLGEFAEIDTNGAPVSLMKIKQAYALNAQAHEKGRLTLGVDVASHSPDGRNDDTCITLIRGNKMLAPIQTLQNYREQEVVDKICNLVEEYRVTGEKPLVVVDAAGVGFKVAEKLEGCGQFEVFRFRANERTTQEKKLVHNKRDQAFNGLIRYLDSGGGLVQSPELEEQLPQHLWVIRHDGLATLPDKAKIRKAIGRSPDQADSLMLACLQYEPQASLMGRPSAPAQRATSSFSGGQRGRSRYDSMRRR